MKVLERFLIIGWVLGEELVRENGLFQKETKNGEILMKYFLRGFFWLVEDMFFEKNSGISRFLSLPPRNSRQNKASPWKYCKIVLDHLEIPKPVEILHDFFLITPGDFILFLTNLWTFRMLFLQYPWIFHILNFPCLFFFSRLV